MPTPWTRITCLALLVAACASPLERAESALARGDYDEAEALYRKAAHKPSTQATAERGIADVYVDEAFRGQGVARQMVRQLLSHPEIAEVDNTYLLTQDAQLVYRPLGFDRYPHPERFMVRRRS